MFCFAIFIGKDVAKDNVLVDVIFSSKQGFSPLEAAQAYARGNSWRLHNILFTTQDDFLGELKAGEAETQIKVQKTYFTTAG